MLPEDLGAIQIYDCVMKNDTHEKYTAVAPIRGELILCNVTKPPKHPKLKVLAKETYEDYLSTLATRNHSKDQWIYNILDGTSEQESVLYRDDTCVVFLTYLWNGVNLEKLHVLSMPTDRSLRCLRSLTGEHVALLEHMKTVTLQVIEQKYGLTEKHLKMYFHHDPSTYHLHFHTANIANLTSGSSIEYCHELNSVIFNLSVCPDYYQRAVLLIRE